MTIRSLITYLSLLLAFVLSVATGSSLAVVLRLDDKNTEPAVAPTDSKPVPGVAAHSVNSTANHLDNSTPPAVPALQSPSSKPEVPGISYGVEERFRFEGYNNTDFNSENTTP